jgi:predicted amidohydrolase YtcJ
VLLLRKALVFLLPVLLLVAAASRAEDKGDLVLRNGVFHTVSPAGRVEGSLVARGGRIVYLGPDAGVARFQAKRAKVIDLGGRTVVPGLIDAHSHLLNLGLKLSSADLRGSASPQEVVDRARESARELPQGAWVLGRGWDQNLWPGQAFPDNSLLSRAFPDRPVWLVRVDGHAGLANARALELAGIGGSTPDPDGGRIVRGADGQPTGVLVDRAQELLTAKIPLPPARELRRQLRLAADACLAVGLTTATDMGLGRTNTSGAAEIEAYTQARAAGDLPLRVALFLNGEDRPLLERWFSRGPLDDPAGLLYVKGVKLYADGALGSRGAALLEPYNDDPHNVGLLLSSEDHMAQIALWALNNRFQIGIHAIGDRANLVALDAIERAFAGKPHPEARFRIEHAQVMRIQDISRLARLGVIASVQPTHATSDMPWAAERVGERRLAGAYAWRKLLNAGARIALGSDFPVESQDPRLGIYAAVTRQDRAGGPEGGWRPEERLTRDEALRGFTLDAAYSLGLDRDLGSLEVGKRADLTVFAADFMTVPELEIPRTAVDLTIVGGRVAYDRVKASR